MTQSKANTGIHRFQGWELRPNERLLLRDGRPAKLGSRAFDLLCVLAQHADRVVSKRELMDLVWGQLIVEENNLSVQINALRKLLGEGVITNVPAVGYRFTPQQAAGDLARPEVWRAPVPSHTPELLGREVDLRTLAQTVGVQPLVTIVGTGGVGKTSLARAVMAGLAPPPVDGAHWLDLGPLQPGEHLLPLVAKSLGIYAVGGEHDHDDLIRSLAPLSALIVLDNCEHLLAEVADLLGPLLRSSPGLRWLATSQEPLRMPGETVYRLGPLEVPLPGASVEEALRYGAVALFCERARAADRRFEITADRMAATVELCRQLDGLPLALEMAAARVASFGLQGVRDQIDQRLRLRMHRRDAPARHHTLGQTYEWSYSLLNTTEQCVFRRLEPFSGGFTAQMAQQLCCGLQTDAPALETWAMLDALSALVDKSLVQRTPPKGGSEPERMQLLESARDFARLQLESTGEMSAVRARHAHVVALAFADAQTQLDRWRDCDWTSKYQPERRNVLVALNWACTSGEPEVLARLVKALAQLDTLTFAPAEIVQYDVPLDVLHQAPLPLRAGACLELGWAHFLDGNRETGTELTLQALSDFEVLCDTAGIYDALTRLIRLYEGRPGMQSSGDALWSRLQQIDGSQVPVRARLRYQGMLTLRRGGPGAVARLQELHDVALHHGFEAWAWACKANITHRLLIEGRFEEAAELARSTVEEEAPHLRAHAMICHNRALALVRLGRIEEARVAARATLRSLPGAAHMIIDLFALAEAQAGRFEKAALMAGWSARFNRERNRHAHAAEALLVTDTLRFLGEALGEARCAALMQDGESLHASTVLLMALPD